MGTIFAEDTFTVSSETNLTSHTPETGGSWTVLSENLNAAGFSSTITKNCIILDNDTYGRDCVFKTDAAYPGSNSFTQITYLNGTPDTPDYSVDLYGGTRLLSAGSAFGAVLRLDTTSGNAPTIYLAYCYYTYSVTWNIYLYKAVSGTFSLLATSSNFNWPGGSLSDGRLYFEAVGTSLTAKVYDNSNNLIVSVSTTDSSITAAGKAGFYVPAAWATGSSYWTWNMEIDRIVATNIGVPSNITVTKIGSTPDEFLLALLKQGCTVLDAVGILTLTNKVCPINFISALRSLPSMPDEFTAANILQKYIPDEFKGTTAIQKSSPDEFLLTNIVRPSIPDEFLGVTTKNGCLPTEFLNILSLNKNNPIDFSLSLSLNQNVSPIESLSLLSKITNLSIESLSSILDIDNPLDIDFDIRYGLTLISSLPIESLLELLKNNNTFNIEGISGISKENQILQIENTSTITPTQTYILDILTEQILNNNNPIEFGSSLITNGQQLVEFTKSTIASGDNPIEILQNLINIGVLNIEYINHFCNICNIPIESLIGLNFIKSKNIEYSNNVCLIDRSLNLDYLSSICPNGVLNIEYLSTLGIQGNVLAEWSNEVGFDKTKLPIEILLAIQNNSIIPIDTITIYTSTEILSWILENRKTLWILNKQKTDWVLGSRDTVWTPIKR